MRWDVVEVCLNLCEYTACCSFQVKMKWSWGEASFSSWSAEKKDRVCIEQRDIKPFYSDCKIQPIHLRIIITYYSIFKSFDYEIWIFRILMKTFLFPYLKTEDCVWILLSACFSDLIYQILSANIQGYRRHKDNTYIKMLISPSTKWEDFVTWNEDGYIRYQWFPR